MARGKRKLGEPMVLDRDPGSLEPAGAETFWESSFRLWENAEELKIKTDLLALCMKVFHDEGWDFFFNGGHPGPMETGFHSTILVQWRQVFAVYTISILYKKQTG